jgi:hypothetical protein
MIHWMQSFCTSRKFKSLGYVARPLTYVFWNLLAQVRQVSLEATLLGDGQQSVEDLFVGVNAARDNSSNNATSFSIDGA